MVILAPENGQRKLPPVGSPSPFRPSTTRQLLDQAVRRTAQPTGGTAGGSGKNTTPPRPEGVIIPPPVAKVPKLPPLQPLPPPPVPGAAVGGGGAPGAAVGGGGAPGAAVGGGGIMLMLGLALLASFGKR